MRRHTTKQVHSFLVASWYRSFVPKYTELAQPLYNLVKKGTKFRWNEETEQATENLKNALTEAPVPTCPAFEKSFVTQTNASNFGLGAVIFQEDENGEHVTSHASRKPTKTEQKYSEKECLAIYWGIQKIMMYLKRIPLRRHHKSNIRTECQMGIGNAAILIRGTLSERKA